MFLALLIGAVIPSAVIESSPQEFTITNYMDNPLWYLVSSTSISIGTFVIWGGVFYWLANQKCKSYIERMVWIFSGLAIVNYMFFGKKLGILTATLQYENNIHFDKLENILNVIVFFVVILVMNFIWKRYREKVFDVLSIGTIALICIVGINVNSIYNSIEKIVLTETNVKNSVFSLSKYGKNIVIIVLDRAMGTYIPYMFKEKAVLKDKFSGFTYYSNVISHGGFTNFGMPGVFGGYEYTPLEMNKRDKDLLVTKHNEALRVMPVLFESVGYKVTVCDPPYANYQWIPDLSIFDRDTNINKYNLEGKFGDSVENSLQIVALNNRNFYFFGLMKCSPVILQKKLYNSGKYCLVNKNDINQEITSMYTSVGISKTFMKPYNVLVNLPKITEISDEGNNFILMTNNTTHEPCMLQEPEYVPSAEVNNTEYAKKEINRFDLYGSKLMMNNTNQVIHYQTNMATLIQLGNWFEYMRENNVYDNTRIIVVSDHGRPLRQLSELVLDDGKDGLNNVEFYFPLMLVKDFNSKTFNISNDFMTNADVPTIAMKEVVTKPINPFTGNEINNNNKYNEKQYILASYKWNVNENNGTTFLPGRWYSVHKNIWNKGNWEIVKEEAVLPY